MRKSLIAIFGVSASLLTACSQQSTPVPKSRVTTGDRSSVVVIPDRKSETPSDDVPAEPVEASKPLDSMQREQAVGTWKQFETGVRWLKVRPDGTATMYIDPDWIAKAVIGSSLTVQIEWTIADGRVMMKSVSGEPATAFKAVSALYGTDRDRAIAQLDDEKFVMLDDSDGSKSEWTRVASDVAAPKALAD